MSRQPKATRKHNAESSELRNYTDSFVNFPSTFWDNVSRCIVDTVDRRTFAAVERGFDKQTKMCRPVLA